MSDMLVNRPEPSACKRAIAAHAAGCLVGAALGMVLGFIASRQAIEPALTVIGAGIGAVVGLVVLGLVARLDSMLCAGEIFSLILTVMLTQDRKLRKLIEAASDPMLLVLIMAGIVSAGLVLGVVLVGLRRLILRLL
jgi:hypothetical protein